MVLKSEVVKIPYLYRPTGNRLGSEDIWVQFIIVKREVSRPLFILLIVHCVLWWYGILKEYEEIK